MKRASEYRRLARISMGRQMGTMAATGFMRSMVDSLVGIVLMFVLFVGLVLLGIQTVALASSGYGAAVIILTLFALVITLLVVAAGALFWLLEGGLIQQAHHAVHGRKVSMTDLFSGFTGGLAWRLIVIGLFNLLMTLFFAVPYVIAVFVSSSADDFTLLEAGAVVGAYLWYMAGILLIFLLFGLAPYILVDQPHLPALLRLIGPAGGEQLDGLPQPHQPGQPLGASKARDHTQRHLRDPHLRPGAGNADVTGHGQLAPAAQGVPVHRRLQNKKCRWGAWAADRGK